MYLTYNSHKKSTSARRQHIKNTMPEHQVLDERYVDKGKLVKLLRELFPNGDFEVEVSHDPNTTRTARFENLAENAPMLGL